MDEGEDSASEGENSGDDDEEEDDDFIKGLLNQEEMRNPSFHVPGDGNNRGDIDGIPFTFDCPETLDAFLEATKTMPLSKIPTV